MSSDAIRSSVLYLIVFNVTVSDIFKMANAVNVRTIPGRRYGQFIVVDSEFFLYHKNGERFKFLNLNLKLILLFLRFVFMSFSLTSN